jgi:hypothetical protein
MKTIQVIVEVEAPDDIDRLDIASWINCHMDNIPYEELLNFRNISSNDLEDINIIMVY